MIATSTDHANFYFRDNTVESTTLTIAASGLTSSTLGVNVGSGGGGATRLAINGPNNATTNVCSGPYSAQSYNNSGTPTNVGSMVNVNLNAPAGSFYTSSGCTFIKH